MYKLIGADGKEYGPVSAAQLKEWVEQGRANRYTRVCPADGDLWRTLGEVPEFASVLAAHEPAAMFNTPGASSGGTGSSRARVLAERILAAERGTTISSCLSRGWSLMTSNFWLTVGASTLVLVLVWATTILPVVGPLLLVYVLLGGLDWMFLKLARGEPAELADAFAGFGKSFVPLMLFSVVAQALWMLGFVLLILPAFYVMVVYMLFPALLILDKRLEFWTAMEVSRLVAQRHFWKLLGLILLAFVAAIAGLLACIVGSLVVMAWFTGAIVFAYEDLFGREPLLDPEPQPALPPPPPL